MYKNMSEPMTLAPPATTSETVEANYNGMPLKLSMSDLIFAWQDGLLNTASYIYLALKLDGIGSNAEEEFDINDWCDRWETPKNKKGKTKRPTPQEIMAVLQKLEANGQAQIHMQMSLKLDL